MGDADERRLTKVGAYIWNIWAAYWTTEGKIIPPIHVYREGASGDYVIVTTATNAEMDQFLTLYGPTIEYSIEKGGDWWLPVSRWYGHWQVLLVRSKERHLGVIGDFGGGEASPSLTP